MLRPPLHAIAVAACLAASAASAQPGGEADEGIDLFAEGARMLMERLMADMLPVMRELRGLVDDLGNYAAPELLPNGDILIRRKPESLPPADEGEVDL